MEECFTYGLSTFELFALSYIFPWGLDFFLAFRKVQGFFGQEIA